ncbi:MAG: methionine--tRNA ligase [Candidatus Pacebacteria bacterium]|nr:methionine--tRNA ligase [Candidatus Paceibacterota bacterium]
MAKNKFYITTSIAYTNAQPHLGYALELIQADVLARYNRIQNNDVFFLTGTDEHGQKVVKAAEAAGKSPEEFTDEISEKFRSLKSVLNLSNNDFIRTTDQILHWPKVKEIWLEIKKNGDIYKKEYEGLYCVGCEAFITKKDLVSGKCKIHQKEPEVIKEENYFFKLSKYSKEIEKILEKDAVKIIPKERKNEMLSFVRQGLEDVSFSRPRKDLKWGIPVPDDDSQTIYVWADALVNYLSALEYPNGQKFKEYWPPDIQCLGKDILRFHSTIWLGMLLSLKLALPKNIFVHGFITSSGQKMSKSLGNVIDPIELVKNYGKDSVRYFLLKEIPSSEDGDFTYEKFKERYNADLAGGLGNLTARVIKLAEISNYQFSISNKFSNSNFQKEITKAQKDYQRFLNGFKFNEALGTAWKLITYCDKVVNEEKPWEGGKEKIIEDLLRVISEISNLLKPFLPETSEKIFEQLKTKKSESLFPRLK